jgi:hypothetical protein
MENAEIMKTYSYIIRNFFCCDNKLDNPKTISNFIQLVMDPYGIQDQKEKEYVEQQINQEKERQIQMKKKEEDKNKLFELFYKNKEITEFLFEKIENGEIYPEIKKMLEEKDKKEKEANTFYNIKNFVNLGKEKKHVQLNIHEDVYEYDMHECRSNSSNSLMDIDVTCDKK